MNSTELATWIRELIDKDELWKFYKSKDWIRLKTTILQMNHYECYECRRRGKITRFDTDAEGNKKLISTVHHVHHVRNFPELAMTLYVMDPETGRHELNLVPVCKACHNILHPEKNKKKKQEEGFVNEERW